MKSPDEIKKQVEDIHPILHEIYGMVGAAYQVATWPDLPVKGQDAEYEAAVSHDAKLGDISNLMPLFTAVLNKASRELSSLILSQRLEAGKKIVDAVEEEMRHRVALDLPHETDGDALIRAARGAYKALGEV